MRKVIYNIILLFVLFSCSPEKIEAPEETPLNFQLATTGGDKFENYIHSLSIYAFRLIAGGSYVYDRTLAELDADGIKALENVSGRENAKFVDITMPVGEYKFFAVGNAAGKMTGNFEKGITQPGEILLSNELSGQDSVFFLGNTAIRVLGSMPPVKITLKRAVSKLAGILYRVPSEVDSIRIDLGNIARNIAIDGTIPGDGISVRKYFGVKGGSMYAKDTVVFEMITFPTARGVSPFSMTFRALSGQEQTKEMPSLQLLPNKYIRVNGIISDEPGALLSFKTEIHLFIFDGWVDRGVPDFTLKPAGE